MADESSHSESSYIEDSDIEASKIEARAMRRIKMLDRTAVLVQSYADLHLCKEPRVSTGYTGQEWVDAILQGHHIRCHEMFRMEAHVFYELCSALQQHGLQPTRDMQITEMVAIFLHTVGHAVGSRVLQERFQRSAETISRHFHSVLDACCALANSIIKPQDPTFSNFHAKIRHSNRYWPFFKHAIGAIDGTHVPCVVPASERIRYIGRKGYPTQNVMAVCDWDMCFTFVLAGWEGTAHDARIFDHALTTPSMNFPHPPRDKYYLVDAGYPTPIGYLGPYRSERYHLPDFRRSERFQNQNEMFNYLHSSLRCTIERTFGVWKNKFTILQRMGRYKFDTQVKIVCATMAVHNLIRRTSLTDNDFLQHESEDYFSADEDRGGSEDNEFHASQVRPSVVSSSDMSRLRNTIRDEIVNYHWDR